ncbi:MAG: PRC-barrel domain-containing protein [Candidatus Aenigmarchaeota archaeon]|nr:PRC-barrel domain-containing protein [Candidatus Aenigmarchaeota archaeon]
MQLFWKKLRCNYLSLRRDICIIKISEVLMMTSRGRELLGKVVVSEETGRKFGVIGDMNFVSESGELLSLVLVEPTRHVSDLSLERDENSRLLVPFSSVRSVGDFVIISEKDIV